MTTKNFTYQTTHGKMTVTGIDIACQYFPPPNVLAALIDGYWTTDQHGTRFHVSMVDILDDWNVYTPDDIAELFPSLDRNPDLVRHMYFTLQCFGNGSHEYAYLTQLFFRLME